jgi:hypothetical protein
LLIELYCVREKHIMESKKKSSRLKFEDEHANLGLDADHSSDGPTTAAKLNDDNDRISGNPDGESDDTDDDASGVYSPLEDK